MSSGPPSPSYLTPGDTASDKVAGVNSLPKIYCVRYCFVVREKEGMFSQLGIWCMRYGRCAGHEKDILFTGVCDKEVF